MLLKKPNGDFRPFQSRRKHRSSFREGLANCRSPAGRDWDLSVDGVDGDDGDDDDGVDGDVDDEVDLGGDVGVVLVIPEESWPWFSATGGVWQRWWRWLKLLQQCSRFPEGQEHWGGEHLPSLLDGSSFKMLWVRLGHAPLSTWASAFLVTQTQTMTGTSANIVM